MSVVALRDFVVVVKDEPVKQTSGGLFMPSTVEEKIVTGTISVIGSGRVTPDGTVVPLEVVVGDKVVFNKHMATELKVDGGVFQLIKEEHLLCVLK